MMLKSLFASWFKRHEHKSEETKMADEVQGVQVDAGSQADPVTMQVQGVIVAPSDAPVAQPIKPDPSYYVEPANIKVLAGPAESHHDAFAEKLRHVLKLAEVEVEHVWEEAVALAKKLV